MLSGVTASLLGCNGGGGGPTSAGPPPAAPTPTGPAFTEVTQQAGIRFQHENGAFGRKYYPERMGSGAAFFDANGDGFLDLLLVNGAPLPGHPKPNPQPSRFYLNQGDGTFVDKTAGSGLEKPGFANGVAVGDVNNDGHNDLYITRIGGNSLFLGKGDGTFTDITTRAGVVAGGYCTSAAMVDVDADGLLDLYVCRYIPWAKPADDYQCHTSDGEREYCSVHAYGEMEHRLFRNLGKGRFTDATKASGIAGTMGRGLAVTCADFDVDGDTDIFVANDESPNFLWQNDGKGHFQEAAAARGFALNDRGLSTAGMGLDVADADGDGSDDVIESDFQFVKKTLYVNDGQGFFTPNGENKGLRDMTLNRLAFGIGFLDYDLDGWPDVFVANGHVSDTMDDPNAPFRQTAQLFHNDGKAVYSDTSAQLGEYGKTPYLGRGVAFGDYDNDGDTDMVVINNGGPAVLLRNENPHRHHWIGVRCVGTRQNRSGLGVRITVEAGGRSQSRETRTASSYLSSCDPRVLVGLGTADRVEKLTVRWPGGQTQEFVNPPVDRYLTATEGKATPD